MKKRNLLLTVITAVASLILTVELVPTLELDLIAIIFLMYLTFSIVIYTGKNWYEKCLGISGIVMMITFLLECVKKSNFVLVIFIIVLALFLTLGKISYKKQQFHKI